MQQLLEQYKKGIQEFNTGLSLYQSNSFEKAVVHLGEANNLFKVILQTPIPEKYVEKFTVVKGHHFKTFELLVRSKSKLIGANFIEVQKEFIKLIQMVTKQPNNEAKLYNLIQMYVHCKLKAKKSSQQQPTYTLIDTVEFEITERRYLLELELKAIEETLSQDVLFKEILLTLKRLVESHESKQTEIDIGDKLKISIYKLKRMLLYLHSTSQEIQPISDLQIIKELEEVKVYMKQNDLDVNYKSLDKEQIERKECVFFIINSLIAFINIMKYFEKQPSNIEEILSVNNTDTLSLKNKDLFSKVLRSVFQNNLETFYLFFSELKFTFDLFLLCEILTKKDIVYIFYILTAIMKICIAYGFSDIIIKFRNIVKKPPPDSLDPDLKKHYQNLIGLLTDHALIVNDKEYLTSRVDQLDQFQQLEFKRRFSCRSTSEYMSLDNEITSALSRLNENDYNVITKYHYMHCKTSMKFDIQQAYQHLIQSLKIRGVLEKEKKTEAKSIEVITKKSIKSELKASVSVSFHFEQVYHILLNYQQLIRIHEIRGNFSSCETCIKQALRFAILMKCFSFVLYFIYLLTRLKLNRHDFDDVDYLLSLSKELLSQNECNKYNHHFIEIMKHKFTILETSYLQMDNRLDEAESLINSFKQLDIIGGLQKVSVCLKKKDTREAHNTLRQLCGQADHSRSIEDILWVKYYSALFGHEEFNYDFLVNYGLSWNDVPIPLKKRLLSVIREERSEIIGDKEHIFLSSMSMGIRLKHTLQDLFDFYKPNKPEEQTVKKKEVEKLLKRLSITNQPSLTSILDLRRLTTDKSFIEDFHSILPNNLCVCNVCVSDDCSSLIISIMNNHRGGDNDCIVLPLSLKVDQETLTKSNRLFNDFAIKQTQQKYHKSNISENSALTSSSMNSYVNYRSYQALFEGDNILHRLLLSMDHIQLLSKESFTLTDNAQWWKTRKELDEKLLLLLQHTEDLMFGPLKICLIPRLTNELNDKLEVVLDKLIEQIEEILSRELGSCINLPDIRIVKLLLGSFSALREENDFIESISHLLLKSVENKTTTNTLITSLLQSFYSSFAQAFSEEQTVSRRRGKKGSNSSTIYTFKQCCKIEQEVIRRKHIVYCLDKLIQQLPIETMPLLKNHPSSRMPSLLLLYYQLSRKLECNEELKLNNVFYVLNPSGDLNNSEERFKPYFQSRENWNGLVGEAPREEQVYSALENNDLLIYVGHGAGEKYYNPHKIRRLTKCCPVLLMGCSSGRLKEYGFYEPNGTILNFLLAGSPFVVANLWDVTDKDIDRLTEHLFNNWLDRKSNRSISEVLTEARETCRLPYLIGSATVCYGLPDIVFN
ncbi:hypothetical protein ABK040_001146 [Willaertia magna]